MLKIEKFVTPSPEQWEIIIEGARNPMNSWDRIDSYAAMNCDDCGFVDRYGSCNPKDHNCEDFRFYYVGENDQKLLENLAKGGPVHAKYRRMIPVWLTLTAPLYWWKEFDTYKVGTVANSCSTMHKIQANEITRDTFSFDEDLLEEEILFNVENPREAEDYIDHTHFEIQVDRMVDICEDLRKMYNHYIARSKTVDTDAERQHFVHAAKKCWRMLIQFMPSSYNQKRTVMLNYEVLVGIYRDRKNHKLDEWHVFCDWIRELPYSELITGENEE